MLKNLYIILVGLLGVLPIKALASPDIDIHRDIAMTLGDQIEYFVDVSDEYTISDIRKLDDDAWTLSQQSTPNFGYTPGSYWFRFSLSFSGLISMDTILSIDYPLLDHIDLYHFESKHLIKHTTTGDTYSFEQRPVPHRNFLFPITVFHDTSADIYIKVKTQGSVQVPITIYDQSLYMVDDQHEQFIKAFYYGMMIIMGLYNLFLYFSIRERPYLYYVAFIFSMVTLMAGAHGYLYQYLLYDYPAVQQLSILIGVPAAMMFACLFASSFLRLNVIAPRLNLAVNAFSTLFLLSVIGAFFLPYGISTRASVFLAIPACLVVMIVGPYAWSKGQSSARYFTFAWALLLCGMMLGALSKFGFIPRNLFTEYSVNIGSAFEALLLSFALADRLNSERNARYKAQKERLIESVQRQEAEEKLYYQATHQIVDGFPNMVVLQKSLHDLVHREDKSTNHFTLVFLHLEHIHEINKTLGHANAELIISLFSERLQRLEFNPDHSVLFETSEQGDFYFCHIEGIVYAHIIKSGNIKQAELTIKGIRKQLMEPIEYNGMRLDLGLSIGMASYPVHGDDIATLTRHTRVAIDSANTSNQHIGVYASDVNPYSARRLALMGELKKAINDNTLELYFQPIVDCSSRKVIASEALLRWNHPNLGFIPPTEFVSLAEKTGIMRSLTQWVISSSLTTLKQWLESSPQMLMSLNVSAINLQEKDFAQNLLSQLAKHQIPTGNLVLEVTETSVMSNPDDAIEMLNELAHNGLKIAIDDFGTGHSSLSYIRKLPVYEVKIDRSFISSMDKTQDDALITQAALNLSHDLGYKVVAEGVENESILETLKSMGCDYIQGYHIAKPMPASDFAQWVETFEQDNDETKAG